MIEGKKISKLDPTKSLQDSSCFPVLFRGATKRITFSALINNIIAKLPDATHEEFDEIKRTISSLEKQIAAVSSDNKEVAELLKDVTLTIDGQNATIIEYTAKIREFEREIASSSIAESLQRINSLIPSTASNTNKLTDKAYVDESIQTSTAVNRGNFDTYADLMAYSGTVTRNDYATVGDDETHGHECWRYKWNDEDEEWTPEYRVNEAPMTTEQLAAINSGITAEILQRLIGATETPVGTMSLYLGAVAPTGYLMCDRTYSADDYPQLWDVLPDNVKNIDERTFDIDFRELVPVGAGKSTRPDIAAHDIYNVGQFKDDLFKSHNHDVKITGGEHGHTVRTGVEGPYLPSVYQGGHAYFATNAYEKSSTEGHSHKITIYNKGGNTTHGKQIGVNYIIKY